MKKIPIGEMIVDVKVFLYEMSDLGLINLISIKDAIFDYILMYRISSMADHSHQDAPIG